MAPSEIARVEEALGVKLPAKYREALAASSVMADWTDQPEFITDPGVLIAENQHFVRKPTDLSDIKTPGVLGAVKFWLLYGSGKRVRAHRARLHKQWTLGKRFIIGLDLSEEQYYIMLSDPDSRVHCFQLESQRSKVLARNLDEWLVEVQRRRNEAERDA